MTGKQVMARSSSLLIATAMIVSMFCSCSGKKPVNAASNTAASSGSSNVASDVSSSSGNSATSGTSTTDKAATGKAVRKPIERVDLSKKVVKSGTPSAYIPKDIVVPDIVIYPIKDPVMNEHKVDLGGRTVKIGTGWSTDYNKGTVLGLGHGYEALQSVAKDYNCKLKLVTVPGIASELCKQLQTYSTAGLSAADIYDSQDLMSSVIQNHFYQDLRKVDSIDLAHNQWNEASTLGSSYKGGIYGVSINQQMMNRVCVFFNKTIAQKYHLGDFYTMVIKRQWNLDNFKKICQSVYDQSGKKVQGLVSLYKRYYADFMIQDDSPMLTMKNNKVIFNGNSDKSLRVLNWMQDLCKAGLVDTTTLKGDDAGQTMTDFEKSKVLFWVTDDYQKSFLSKDMTDDYGILPLPLGWNNTMNYYSIVSNVRFLSLYIGDKNYEQDGAIITALSRRAYVPIASWDTETAKVLRDSQSLQMLHLIMQSKPKFTPTFGDKTAYKAYDNVYNALDNVYLQKNSAKQAMGQIATAVQTDLDKIYNK